MSRLGPGSDESTKQAMMFYPDTTAALRILDIGCGVGAHTFLLADHYPNATIVAIDNHMPYVDHLNDSSKQLDLSDRVTSVCMSMFELTFAEESFDLIWAEGAIYIAGFEKGITYWRRLLKRGGYLICSELSWLTNMPSDESYQYWHQVYPEIDTVSNKVIQIKQAGYAVKGNYVSPMTDWTIEYYDRIENNLRGMRDRYADHEIALQVIDMLQREIDVQSFTRLEI